MTDKIEIWNEDCVSGMRSHLQDASIDCVITSIPFAALFSYSHLPEDIGNNSDSDNLMACQFSLHFRFFLEELYRVMKPGTVFCCHIQQLLTYKVKDGYMGMRDFRGSIISMAMNHGFQPHGEVAIIKNPQAVARRNNLHSLMFATASRDSRMLAPAMNDYVIFLKKPGEANALRAQIEAQRDVKLVEPSPIIEYGPRGNTKRVRPGYKTIPYQVETWDEGTGITQVKTITGGNGINPEGWFTKNDWIAFARGAWEDINEIDILEGRYNCKEAEEEKHVCPLQLEVIRRCMKLYSGPGETVLDPFMGIGSTAWVAVEQGRECCGFELKESYHRMAVANIAKAQEPDPQMSMFA